MAVAQRFGIAETHAKPHFTMAFPETETPQKSQGLDRESH
ncbi:hypothetical protein AA0119_g3220 [Alternaria tenuissima]|uniref:Uncharacterized protein n=1 Tax=Alternaria tenuissima TaxID=119927 RepID=A0ABY0GI41_9PLEO|nr:hypothetical protein AA0118_g6202 [Alternaria tenuissima]RYN98228.1 hypothetical protein AA0120_g2554 [Alternaria tenuissima]RYO05719.1 hypothetical protein AA0119_g3220 [Alternaria tenuissima]RYO20953.1 hypothetical protein AA0121_g3560 [Alternaria tenuissima]RYO64105.1 hypothetical protein AA0116_g3834 [Alternaria tenuissima]